MKTFVQLFKLSIFTVFILALAACGSTPEVASENLHDFEIANVSANNGNPYVELVNGSRFALSTLDELALSPSWLQTTQQPQLDVTSSLRVPLPSSVDLTAYQTGFRNQGSRDTCSTFGATAALEAAYKRRYGLTLDLSEQYFNHLHRSMLIDGTALPNNENPAGAIGGGNPYYDLQILVDRGIGVPLETTVPYSMTLPNTPLVNWSQHFPQWEMDSFNLDPSNLPQGALENARYRPLSLMVASGSNLNTLTWFKSQLAAKREVVFGFQCCGTTSSNGVWIPGGTASGGHVMLMVGYDNAKQAFLIKNQWGANHYQWFSYDWVTQNLVYEAVAIKTIAAPTAPFTVWENKQLFLGRWNTNLDGWQGTLDLYHLPDPNPTGQDKRLGTYFDHNGTPYRVNGTITGNRLDFYIDTNNPNVAYNASLQGAHYTAYLFSWDHAAMAGSVLDTAGNTWAFHALKGSRLSGTANPGGMRVESYLGSWQMNHDGWKGTLSISSANTQTRALAGTYTDAGGQVLSVTGNVNADPRLVSFTINFPGAPQTFNGYLHGWEQGLMSGTTTWSGIPFGFYASRR